LDERHVGGGDVGTKRALRSGPIDDGGDPVVGLRSMGHTFDAT
jgi:hypothetical protein